MLLQAEVIGDSIGKGVARAVIGLGLILLSICGFVLFLYVVRKIDKKINK